MATSKKVEVPTKSSRRAAPQKAAPVKATSRRASAPEPEKPARKPRVPKEPQINVIEFGPQTLEHFMRAQKQAEQMALLGAILKETGVILAECAKMAAEIKALRENGSTVDRNMRSAASFPPASVTVSETENGSKQAQNEPKTNVATPNLPQSSTGASAAEAPEPSTEASAPAPAADLTMIRNKINEKAGEGKTASIVAALGKYGAKNASTLDESHYTDFYNDLCKL